MKIVFVEDDPTIQKLVRAALRAAPHEVLVAADGNAGLALIRKEHPDVVFTDIAMPGMDGYEMVSSLRDDPELADIPVVFMTASVQRTQLDEARERGATDILTKPFSMSDLRAAVENAVRR